jgi:hypothetical protein
MEVASCGELGVRLAKQRAITMQTDASSISLVRLIAISAVFCGIAGCGGTGSGTAPTSTHLAISPTAPQVATGQSLQLTATASSANVTGQVTWSSSNSAVATVGPQGQLTAISVGFTTIHASLAGASATAQVTVTATGAGVPPGYLYIASADVHEQAVPGAVYQYAIAGDGSLTPLTVASVPAGITPTSIISDPAGKHVYVGNAGDGTLSQYAVSAGGALQPLSPPTVTVPVSSSVVARYALSVAPDGQFLYLVALPPGSAAATIAQYSIGADGTLTPLAPASISQAAAYGSLAIDRSGRYAYLPGRDQVFQLAIASDGTLSPLAPGVPAAPTVAAVAVDPSGQFAEVLSVCANNACDGEVAPYSIGANGTLSPAAPTATLGPVFLGGHVNPVALVFGGMGAYVLTNFMGVDTNAGSIYGYALESGGFLGTDTLIAAMPLSSGAVAESFYGSGLYALSANALGQVSGMPAGGHVDYFAATHGEPATSSTPIPASLPTGMTLVAAH